MKYLRYLFLAGGALHLALGLAFAFQTPLAAALWPWPDGRLSYLFIGSILAAISVAMLWIGWTSEWGALPAGSLNVVVIAATTTVYFFWLSARGRSELIVPGIAGTVALILSGAAFLWSQKIPLKDARPTPRLVRISFGVFVAALLLAGTALVLRLPTFPWDVNPDSSVIFGCIFLGDAFYFLHAILKPRWHNAFGQLLSFLAYDLVLIIPFVMLFGNVKPEHLLSLVVYTAVLLYSGALSIYYLFIHPPAHSQPGSTTAGKP